MGRQDQRRLYVSLTISALVLQLVALPADAGQFRRWSARLQCHPLAAMGDAGLRVAHAVFELHYQAQRLKPRRPLAESATAAFGGVAVAGTDHGGRTQDRIRHFSAAGGEVAVLADGMGGDEGGDEAAAFFVRRLEHHLADASSHARPPNVLRDAIQGAAKDLYDRNHERSGVGGGGLEGMAGDYHYRDASSG